MRLYVWLQECLQAWEGHHFRGIAHVVTGAGKTFLALNAMDFYLACYPEARIHIVVPTIPLARQWQLALLHHEKNPELRPGFFGGGVRDASDRQVMIYVKLLERSKTKGYSPLQLKELRSCLMEGLCRPDCLLPTEQIERHIKAAKSTHERNYWKAMRKLSGAVSFKQ